MSPPPLTQHELLQILEVLRASEFSEFKLRSGDLELEARRAREPSAPAEHPPAGPATSAASLPSSAPAAVPPDASRRKAETADQPQPAARARSPRANLVTAPMVGTFYAAPEPGAAPFVQVGQRVEHATALCIIEVMKLMNTIHAGCQGLVTEILVGDGQAVEHGQLLMVIEPSQPDAP